MHIEKWQQRVVVHQQYTAASLAVSIGAPREFLVYSADSYNSIACQLVCRGN
jgi:hypothetical protein